MSRTQGTVYDKGGQSDLAWNRGKANPLFWEGVEESLSTIFAALTWTSYNRAYVLTRKLYHGQYSPLYVLRYEWTILQLSAQWPGLSMAARLEVTLFWYRPYGFCCVREVVLMLTSWHLNERAERSVSKEGQLTEDTTVKWPIVLSHVERKAYSLHYLRDNNCTQY